MVSYGVSNELAHMNPSTKQVKEKENMLRIQAACFMWRRQQTDTNTNIFPVHLIKWNNWLHILRKIKLAEE